MLVINQKTQRENHNTVADTSSGVKQKQPHRNELPTSENENTTLPKKRKTKQP